MRPWAGRVKDIRLFLYGAANLSYKHRMIQYADRMIVTTKIERKKSEIGPFCLPNNCTHLYVFFFRVFCRKNIY